jgi:acetylornithine/N-succinyldiaminopimelate aminotransferase
MPNNRELFLKHLAQTSPAPLSLEIDKAEGIYIFDKNGKKYIDLISGISVSNIGHRHPDVVKAIKEQLDKYMHLMVYGEYIQTPQVLLAEKISSLLPPELNSVYFVNSGSEATEGALKLAKKHTSRTEIIAFRNAYHGSTQGALSVMGNEKLKQDFRPLLPDIKFLTFDNEDELSEITNKTACVIIEPIQGEAGVRLPQITFLQKLREQCNKTKTLLIFDEIQTGFGRTGKLFALEKYAVTPDILLLAKGMGGGMPIGAFIASKEIMSSLSDNPPLGHITTFGGHPVCCAASLANINTILSEKLTEKTEQKSQLFNSLLKHKKIKEIRCSGLLLAVEFGDEELNMKVISKCIENGIITDWFLFCSTAMRIAPPLTITNEQITYACERIINAIDNT